MIVFHVCVCAFGRARMIVLCVYTRIWPRMQNCAVCVYVYSLGTCSYAPSLDLGCSLSHRSNPKP